jgi:signal transduction histidine kinase
MTVPSANTRIQSRIDRLVSLLPVREPESLLKVLALVWAEECGCNTLFVSIVVHDQAYGLYLNNGQTSLTTTDCSQSWSAARAAEWLTAISGECSKQLNAITVIPFEQSENDLSVDAPAVEDRCPGASAGTVGGLLAFDAESGPCAVQPLADLSARLTLQLRLVCIAGPENQTTRILRDLKLESMAEFAAGAGHEINNPVATIVGRSALLLKGERDPERRRALETIGGQAYRIRDMIGDAMTFARPPEIRSSVISPAALITDVLASFSDLADSQGTSVEVDLEESLQIRADSEQFRVVAASLFRNSFEALREGGRIRISLRSDRESHCILRVTDNGQGLDDVEREHLFDPFFSGRQAGRGLGFGLSRCWQILRQHGGWIDTVDCDSGFSIVAAWPLDRAG